MIRTRVEQSVARVRIELRRALTEEHSPREIAGSFALGTFITMLPSLGIGLLLFVVIAYIFEWASKIALAASVVVFNPVVKWGVYAASFSIGVVLLGPVEGVTATEVSIRTGRDAAMRLIIGNLILALVATAVSYVLAYRFLRRYQRGDVGDAVEDVLDDIVDDVPEH